MTPAILVEGVAKTYRRGAVRALDGVSFTVEPGETLGVIGPNGAGKTTLMGCLLGFLAPDTGRIEIDGRAPDDLAVRAVTGYMPERLVPDRWMTGRAFLAHHHALAGLPRASRQADCERALERTGLGSDAGGRRVGDHSRGMLQRLAFAQALLGSPRLLFLDEPISGVDPAGVLLFRRLLADLSRDGVTIVVNSHQLAEIERSCSRVVFVDKGRIASVETLQAGASQSRVLRVRFGADARFAHSGEGLESRLGTLAVQAGAALVASSAHDARFTVADDAGATRLLAALLAGGVPVVEAAPEEGRLERLFGAPALPPEDRP